MSLKIRYLDVPQGVQEEAIAQGQGQIFSRPETVIAGGEDEAYATLEPTGWPLDGSRLLLPDAPRGIWWSDRASDANGIFSTPPTLTISLPAPCTATGISFTFSPKAESWCSRVGVTWLRGTNLLARTEAQPDGPRWTLTKTVEDFDTVRIELMQTNIPRSFVKLLRVEIGQVHWFSEDEISSVEMVSESDPMLGDLTVDTLSVILRDKKGRDLRPQRNQRLEVYRDDELLDAGYILSSTREPGDWYSISCQGAVGLLEDDFLGGIYDKVPAPQVLKEILGGIEYEQDPFFEEQTVTGYLPVCSRRQALQQLAFSLGAQVNTRCGGKIRLLLPEAGVSHTFRKDQIFHGGKLELLPRVAQVELTAHSLSPSGEREILLQDEYVCGTDVLFTFSEPHHSYAITGGAITGSGANWVTISAEAEVTLTALTYIHSKALHTKRNAAAWASERGNRLSVQDATLIHRGNVEAVLQRLYEAASQRQIFTFDAVVTDQYPGQSASSEDMWGELIQGCITSMHWELTKNGQTARVTISGNQVPARIADFYAGELMAGREEAEHLCS